MSYIASGELDRRITIKEITTARNDVGEPVETQSTFATVWASKRDLSSREFLEARQYSSEITTEFKIRYLPGIKHGMVIDFDGDTYRIEQVKELGRKVAQIILASAFVE